MLTSLGFLVLPFGLILLVFSRKSLLRATLFAAPFFDTGVLRIREFTLVRPAQYFGVLLMLVIMVERIVGKTKALPRMPPWLWAVLGVLLVSTFMPFWISAEVIPTGADITTLDTIVLGPLELTDRSLTQLLYPLFSLALLGALVVYHREQSIHLVSLRALVYASVPILLSGIAYILLVLAGESELVYEIHYQLTGVKDLYFVGIEGSGGFAGLPRMHTFVGEPGYSGAYFLVALGPLLASISCNSDVLFPRRVALVLSAMLILGTLLTSGTTGYVGIPLLVTAFMAFSSRTQAKRLLWALAVALSAVAIGVILLSVWLERSFIDYLVEEHLGKLQLEAGSGETRMFIILHNLSVFLHAPLLGVGYGNERGGSAITFLLSNIGIIGTLVVYYALGSLLSHAKRVLRHAEVSRDTEAVILGATVSVVVVFALGHFAQTEVIFLWPFLWVLVAVAATGSVEAPLQAPREAALARCPM